MPVNRHRTGFVGEWQAQQAKQGDLPQVPELSKTDHHTLVAIGGLIFVRSEKPIPPRQIEAEIAVCLTDDHRVVDPVHIRRHHQQPQQTVDFFQDVDIAVVEQGSGVAKYFEEQNSQWRGPMAATVDNLTTIDMTISRG
jgi:hypothetical protein